MIDLAFIRDNDPQRIGTLASRDTSLAQIFMRQAQPDVVALEGAVSNQDRIAQGTLSQQMQLVCARREIDR